MELEKNQVTKAQMRILKAIESLPENQRWNEMIADACKPKRYPSQTHLYLERLIEREIVSRREGQGKMPLYNLLVDPAKLTIVAPTEKKS